MALRPLPRKDEEEILKAISCELILTSASTRADGSLGLRFSTPELSATDKTAFFELLNQNLKAILQPVDTVPDELHTVRNELETKTPGQRLRACLFVLWKQGGEQGDYDSFYRRNMERIIEYVKGKLKPT